MDTPSPQEGASSPSQMSPRATVEMQMDEWERDMLSLRAAIIDLNHKQYALKTKLNATSRFMLRLPLEVISHIFDLVIQCEDMGKNRLLPLPFFLGKICKAWRDIVWTTPRLWSFLTISLDIHRPIPKEVLREWLDRSGNSLLHFSITVSSRSSPLYLESIVQIILKTCRRWKTLITCPFPALSEAMATRKFRFPKLTLVHIKGKKNDDFEELQHDFSRAPLLRTIRLSGFDVMESMTFCWERLVVVNVDSPFLFDDAVAIITQLKAVQKLQIHIERSPRSVPSTEPYPDPNDLPYLSELQIRSTGEGICCLLNCMTTPLLTRLEITQLGLYGGESWVRAIEQLYTRFPLSLSHLSFEDANITETDLVPLLRTLSSLNHFAFTSGRSFKFSSDMIALFKNSHFLPNLTYFSYKGTISFSVKALENTIERRLVASQRSRSLKVLEKLNITYKNKSWIANESGVNPNQLQAFFRRIDSIKSRGTTLNIVWDEKLERQRSTLNFAVNSDSDE